MNVEELDFVGWEPCTVRFDFAENLDPDSFPQQVESWLLKDRLEARICGCVHSYSEFALEGETAVVVRGEWFCRICIQVLADAVEQKFPTLCKVTLGTAIMPSSGHDDEFVSIENKNIELEDRRQCRVGPFLIGKRPVSIGAFEKFIKATNYRTVAEQLSNDVSFRSHCGLSGFSEKARLSVAVKFIAPIDAEAYCQYMGYRLPTEEEWFAAAIIEPTEFDPSRTYQRRLELMKHKNAILFSGSDITSTTTDAGLVVARRGPRYFLQRRWRERMQFERQAVARTQADISTTFRVIAI